MKLDDLKLEYDKLQKEYGAKELDSIYFGGCTVNPDISFISFDFTHFPSSGIGAGPWSTPYATQHIFSNSFE